jgi:hypothetical protein
MAEPTLADIMTVILQLKASQEANQLEVEKKISRLAADTLELAEALEGKLDALLRQAPDAMQFALEENTLLRRAPSHARLFSSSLSASVVPFQVATPLQQRAVQAAAQRLEHISASIHTASKQDENFGRPAVAKNQAAAAHGGRAHSKAVKLQSSSTISSDADVRKKTIALAQQQHDAHIAEEAAHMQKGSPQPHCL